MKPATCCSTPMRCSAAVAGSSCSAGPRKRYPQLLSAESGQQTFRPASAAVVRAEPSGRGFRRDVRGLAAAALELAHALRRMAGAQEAGIRRRADGGNRRAAAAARRGRERVDPITPAHRDARRALPKEAGSLRLRHAEDLRPRSAAVVLRRSDGTAGRRRLRRSSGTTARKSDSWLRSGQANISSRSMPCSTT